MTSTLLWVALGGAIGAVLRFLAGALMSGLQFPYATFVINIAGALAIGALWAYAEQASWFAQWGRAFLVTGILGGFTTYSAFSLETLQLLQQGQALAAATYVTATVAGCLVGVFIAYRLVS